MVTALENKQINFKLFVVQFYGKKTFEIWSEGSGIHIALKK